VNDFASHVRATGKRSISVFGDSITAGATVPEALRWANRLATRLDLDLSNKGISGTVLQSSPDANGTPRAGNGMGRFRRDLLGPDRSDLIAILYGVNDARHTGAPHSINHGGFMRDYRMLLEELRAAGFAASDICIGSPAHIPDAGFAVGDPEFVGQTRAGFERYVATVRSLAQQVGTFYAPVNERMQSNGGDALVLPDHVHPNGAGHSVIADAFAGATLLN
jgi:lysophospholipase L1-like esterase